MSFEYKKPWNNQQCYIQGGSGSASNITFENIEMHNVSNPIIIDQNYCDRRPCKEQVINQTTRRLITPTSSLD